MRPEAMASASRIDASRGEASIGFAIPVTNQDPKQGIELDTRTLLLDSQTGNELGDYVFDPEAGSMVCFDSSVGYTMFGFDEQQFAKVIVPLK
jgi:hypothetical protein